LFTSLSHTQRSDDVTADLPLEIRERVQRKGTIMSRRLGRMGGSDGCCIRSTGGLQRFDLDPCKKRGQRVAVRKDEALDRCEVWTHIRLATDVLDFVNRVSVHAAPRCRLIQRQIQAIASLP
jgi:hypothetical protein